MQHLNRLNITHIARIAALLLIKSYGARINKILNFLSACVVIAIFLMIIELQHL